MVFLGQVLVFSISTCPFCRRAKKFLSDLQVPYVDVNLEKYPERRYEMEEKTGRRTVPQIFFNSKHIGGYDDLKKLNDEGKLDGFLKEVAETEVPPDAPQPPPDEPDEVDSNGDDQLLPSQRGKTGSDDNCLDCTPDELAALVREIRDNSALIGPHTYRLVSYKNTFVGSQLVDWLIAKKGYKSREAAVKLGQDLYRGHFIHHVTFDHEFKDEHLFYRVLGDGHLKALNAKLSYACIPRPAIEVAEDLRKYILEIYGDFLSPDGFHVDYQGISQSKKFEAYVRATAELKRVDLATLSREEKVAFFINIYNALVIHAFVVQGPPNNLWKRFLFFYRVSYIIGGRVFSLNDIESGILRGNRKPVGALKRPFSNDDPRLKISLKEPEPRIHFALVCGAKSCPPIKTYSIQHIDEELTLATQAFLEGEECTVDVAKREVTLSMILKWYKVDFGTTNAELLGWIADHLPDGLKKQQLKELIEQPRSVKVKFRTYNWDLNS